MGAGSGVVHPWTCPPTPELLVQVVIEIDFAGPNAGGIGEFNSIGERTGKERNTYQLLCQIL